MNDLDHQCAERELSDDALLLAYAEETAMGDTDNTVTIVMPRNEAVRLYEAALRECGWERGRNHLQVCLSDCGFYSFDFAPMHSGMTTVRIVDFTPDF